MEGMVKESVSEPQSHPKDSTTQVAATRIVAVHLSLVDGAERKKAVGTGTGRLQLFGWSLLRPCPSPSVRPSGGRPLPDCG